MPQKVSKKGRKYDVSGKAVTWHPEDDDGEQGNLTDIRIPLRMKMGLILSMAEQELDATGMARILEAMLPNQSEAIAEMDVNDFQDMFSTWQDEYNAVTGSGLGESSPSPA